MASTPRMYEPNVVYEVTTRTIQGRYLLRPSPRANEIIAGVIGRAQVLFPEMRLYGVVFLSTHSTWLVSSPLAWQIATFMGYVNGELSARIGRLHDWPGKMWERPHRPIPILDDASLVERFKHLLAQSCKEGLVASPRKWPGVSCVAPLLGGEPLRGVWFDLDARRRVGNRGDRVKRYDYARSYQVTFDKIPCWSKLDDKAYASLVRQLVEEVEAEARSERAGKPFLGARAVCGIDPHHRPKDLARSPAPMCHTSRPRLRDAFREKYRLFVTAFRTAAEQLKSGLEIAFPPNCFPPRPPFVLSSA